MNGNILHGPPVMGRIILGICCLLLIATTSNAYTIVLRDGRHIEIPAHFALTTTTLTYEVTTGIQVTLQLASIDISATEKTNKQLAGTFMRNLDESKISKPVSAGREEKPRTITNLDLESFRRLRLASEVAYEHRRQELGLPSAEETRRRAARDDAESLERLQRMRAETQDEENMWRERASGLRSEIAATDARIDFLRARINDLSTGFSTGVFLSASPFPFRDRTAARGFGPHAMARHEVIEETPVGSRFSGRVNFGGGLARREVFANTLPFGGLSAFSGVTVLPFQAFGYSLESSTLLVQLDELLAYRVGLQSRWRDLEEDARRAGAPPGWLR